MKVKDLEENVLDELDEEASKAVRAILKSKHRELRQARKMLKEMERKYLEFLDQDVDEIYDRALIDDYA